MQITINPYKPVDFNEKAITKILESSGSLIADIKYDSVRCHLVILPTADVKERPAARLYALSRTNKAIPALRELFATADDMITLGQLLSESLYPEGLIIDGEMMVKGVDFNTGSGLLRRKTPIDTDRLTFMIYGMLPAQEIIKDPSAEIKVANCVMQEQCKVLVHQVKELLPTVDWKVALSYDVFDMPALMELYETVRKGGHEGLVLKDPMGYWKRGKKTGWFKMKPSEETDGNVIDVLWGTEGKANEGKVIGFEVLTEDGVIVNATGLTQDQMERFTANVLIHPNYYKDWACEITYMEKFQDGGYRHPSFSKWRGLQTNPTEKM